MSDILLNDAVYIDVAGIDKPVPTYPVDADWDQLVNGPLQQLANETGQNTAILETYALHPTKTGDEWLPIHLGRQRDGDRGWFALLCEDDIPAYQKVYVDYRNAKGSDGDYIASWELSTAWPEEKIDCPSCGNPVYVPN